VKEASVSASIFTRALDALDEPDSFFGRRSQVLGAVGGDPMAIPPACGVLDVNEEECEDDNDGPSILRASQFRIGIVSRRLLPAVMWSRTQARVRPRMPHHSVPALCEERPLVVFVVGIPEGIVALLRREDLVVVAVDDGALRRAVQTN
jgi:hypothetical protein